MKLIDLNYGQLFVFKEFSHEDYYLKTQMGAISLDTEQLVKDMKDSEEVIKVERWQVYQSYAVYSMPQFEIDKIIEKLLKEYTYIEVTKLKSPVKNRDHFEVLAERYS